MSGHLDAAIVCHRRGDIAGARIAARAGLAERPGYVPLPHFLGMLEMQGGDLVRGRSFFQQAVAVEPGGASLVSLARLYARLGEWAALAALTADVPAGALGNEYLSLRVRALQETGDVDALADALVTFADRRPDDSAITLAAARALADAGAARSCRVRVPAIARRAACRRGRAARHDRPARIAWPQP